MKKMLFVFAGMAVLLSGLVGARALWQAHEEKAEARRVKDSRLSFDFDPMKVSECAVRTSRQTIELKKEQGIWRVVNMYGGLLADASVFLDFLVSLKKINAEERSDDPALLKSYGLADGEGLEIVLKSDGRVLEELILGAKATGKRDNFIRRKGSSRVYAVSEDILTYFGYPQGGEGGTIDFSRWMDKRVLPLNEERVTGITVREKGRTLVDLRRDEEKNSWHFRTAYPQGIDAEKVKGFLQMVSGLRGYTLVDAAEANFKDGDWSVTFEQKSGAPLVLRRKTDQKGSFYLGVSGRGYALKVAVYHFENLTKTDGFFFADNVLSVAPEKVSEVRFTTMSGRQKEILHKREFLSGGERKVFWEGQKKSAVAESRVSDLLQGLVNMRLDTAAFSPRKGEEALALSVMQGKDIRTLRVWDNRAQEGEMPCFPAVIDRLPLMYCVQESSLQSLMGALSRVYEPADAGSVKNVPGFPGE